MLVLSRKRNESIVIDGSIVLTVVDIRGDKVRLGIEAPKHVPIHRSEVYEALQKLRNDVPMESPPGQVPGEVAASELSESGQNRL